MFTTIMAFTLPDGSRLGQKALGAITEDDLEAVLVWLRVNGRAASMRNQYAQVLKAAFRLLEGGWPLHHVQEMLGHASFEQTSTSLNVQQGGLRESMRQLDRSRCNPVVSTEAIEHPSSRNSTKADEQQVTVN
jgi:hypothetical protein